MGKKDLISKSLEVLVAVMILLPLAFALFCFALSWIQPDNYKAFLGIYETPYIPVLAVLTCIVLGLWIILGEGINSKLWKWLPPLVFFKSMGRYGRLFVIILLIIGTLIGLFGEFFGVIEPAF